MDCVSRMQAMHLLNTCQITLRTKRQRDLHFCQRAQVLPHSVLSAGGLGDKRTNVADLPTIEVYDAIAVTIASTMEHKSRCSRITHQQST